MSSHVRGLLEIKGVYLEDQLHKPEKFNEVIISTRNDLITYMINSIGEQFVGQDTWRSMNSDLAPNAHTIFVAIVEQIDDSVLVNDDELYKTFVAVSREINSILLPLSVALWTKKDLSIYWSNVILTASSNFVPQKKQHRYPIYGFFANARGELTNSSISSEIFTSACDSLEWTLNDPAGEIVKKSATESVRKMSRLNRAWFLIMSARREVLLNHRIAFYVMSLECVLSRSKTEVAHKVCERAALLIGTSRTERVEIYQTIKKAYDIRSHVVHGGATELSDPALINISVKCDDYLRKLLQVNPDGPIFDNLFKSSKDDAFETEFLNLVLE